ncbi:hypothetical protein SAMN03159364_02091 [Klebsiella quasipneumoniae]|nr:hypothetical protein SAMN03159364_02091 [Klebsiella quasipneumoniae]
MSGQIALPIFLLRYVSYGAGSAQGAASRRRPLYPRAPASKIAAARSLRLIPAGFGSGRGSVHAKHGPQPASMRAAPAFRERLSDFEAVSTGSFSRASGYINNRPLGIMAGTARTVGRVRRSRHPARILVPCLISCPAALRLPVLGGAKLRENYVGRIRHLCRHPAQSQVRYLTARRYQDRYSAFDK